MLKITPYASSKADFKPNLYNAGRTASAIGLSETTQRKLVDLVIYGKENDSQLKNLNGRIGTPDVDRAPGGWSIVRTDLAGAI